LLMTGRRLGMWQVGGHSCIEHSGDVAVTMRNFIPYPPCDPT
jgi:hypothetical protein